KAGARLSQVANGIDKTYWLDITVFDLTIEENAAIDVSGKGYSGGNGPGADGGLTYGNLTDPNDLGSGGGSAACCSGSGGSYGGVGGGGGCNGACGGPTGGSGGGIIRLNIFGTLTNNGSILANGANGGGGINSAAGGGSGGTVYLYVGTLAGNGSITSNGGNGGSAQTTAGAGGGGRIAIYYTVKTFNGAINAYGGSGNQNGGAGTIYLKTFVDSYPAEVNVSVAENSIYEGSGMLTTSVLMSSFVSEINTYISTCVESVPGYCDVPLEFEFSDAGNLSVSGLSVMYEQEGTKARAMISSEGLEDTTLKNFWFASKTGEVCMLNSYDIFLEVGDDYIGENVSCSMSCNEFVVVRALTACGSSTEFKGIPLGC
ncbi:MAG: hypothetical protein KAI53_01325, partial [Candidatus Aenigmarchaeota archaeon]|nr:hypothetical protein [Candidatus Aenigmarchaeota archaeon]